MLHFLWKCSGPGLLQENECTFRKTSYVGMRKEETRCTCYYPSYEGNLNFSQLKKSIKFVILPEPSTKCTAVLFEAKIFSKTAFCF